MTGIPCVQNFDQVEGGWRVIVSVPESRQPNLSLGVVSRNYHVFIPEKIMERMAEAVARPQPRTKINGVEMCDNQSGKGS